jgi:signal transduction histidine kinase
MTIDKQHGIVASTAGGCSNIAVFKPLRQSLHCVCLLLAMLSQPLVARAATPDLSIYAYEDTKQLVSLVTDAAALLAQKGEAAFKDFQVPNSRWQYGDFYLFAYAADGTCVLQPEEPELVGHNLQDMRDIAGYQVIRAITDIAHRPEPDAAGWVFYQWEDHEQLSPSWKAAYVQEVITPDHKVYALGSGLFRPKIERTFVKNNVDAAVQLLLREGKASFEKLHDPAFRVLDSYIYVMDAQGRMVVDPVFPTNEPRDLSNFTDAVGVHVIRDLLHRMATQDEVWMTYMQPQPGSRTPSRKALYARKITLGGETFYVGSDYFLATPIWMKVENDRRWQYDPPA